MKIIRPIPINDANLSFSSVAENDYLAWSASKTYKNGDHVIYVSNDIHKIYKSIQDNNINNNPMSSLTAWVYVSETNRWKMFDASVGSETVAANQISVKITVVNQFIDSVALQNVDCGKVSVQVSTAQDGVLYNKTFSMVMTDGINDPYQYAYAPIIRKSEFFAGDLPRIANGQITVTLSDDFGGNCQCGAFAIGQAIEIGEVRRDFKLSISDWSDKKRNAYGEVFLNVRDYSDNGDYVLNVPTSMVGYVKKILSEARSVGRIYVGVPGLSFTQIWGFYKDFSIIAQNAKTSICNISIEGIV